MLAGVGSDTKLWDGTDFEHLRVPCHHPWERRPRPYPLVRNYHHSVVRRDSNDWILSMLPPANQEMADRITVHDTGGFMAWVYPDATRARLRVLFDFNSWAVPYDDQFDQHDHFNGDADKARRLTGQLRVLTSGQDTEDGGNTRYGRVLGDIFTRLRATGLDQTSGEAFKEVMFAFNKATLREFELRTAGRTFDSITDYVHNRRDSTAMDAYLLLIPYAMGLRLSPAVRAHPLTRALELCCSDYAGILNDVISFPAEFASGGGCHLIRILCETHRIGVQEALYLAHDIGQTCLTDLDELTDLIDQTDDLDDQDRDDLHRYADGLRKFCAGAMRWYIETPRYNIGHEQVLMPPATHLRDHLGLRQPPENLLAQRNQ
jgi:hypothetical protein